MFKRIALSVAILASVVAGAATVLDLDGVNQAIGDILKPYNTQTTTAAVRFTALDIDENLTQHFGVTAALTKIGSQNLLEFGIPTLEYKYNGPGGIPTLNGAATLKVDLVKAFGQKTLNELAEGAEDLVKDFLKDMTEEYGDAASSEAAVDVLERDQAGNVVRVKMHLSANIDLSKLPQGKTPEKELVISGAGSFDITRTNGELNITVGFNKGYEGFKKDQKGLKEFIERLLSADKETYEEVSQYVYYADKIAEGIVERKQQEERLH